MNSLIKKGNCKSPKISCNKISLLIILCLVLVKSNYGQQVRFSVSFPSPNAASLGEFGKVPVSLFTGTPDVSIPIYEVKEGNFNIPIMLRYHGSGIRVEELPSWVGLGWTLQAGGAITRNVNGYEDEKKRNVSSGKYEGGGFLYCYDLLSRESWYDYADEDQYISFDKQPDEFNFNFNGISGSFYLDHNGEWKVKSDIPIKVECGKENLKYHSNLSYTSEEQMFYKFKLTTPDGTAYIFGGNMPSIEFTRSQYGPTNLVPTATTWNLTQIIDPNGNEVTFNYIRGNLFPQIGYDQGRSVFELSRYYCFLIEPSYLESIKTKNQTVMFYSSAANDLQIPASFFMDKGFSMSLFGGNLGYADIFSSICNIGIPIDYNKHPYSYNDATYEKKEIKFGIITETGMLDPDLTKRKKLDNIVIFPASVTPPNNAYSSTPADFSDAFKIIDLKYIQDPTKRLMLDRITVSSNDYLVNENYSFDYIDNPDIELPDYGTFQMDHWGYYNGREANFYESRSEYELKREPNKDIRYQLEGMLRMIKYPTGGYTEFDYEPHKYASYFDRVFHYINNQPIYPMFVNIAETEDDILCGGLRVKEIKSFTKEGVMSGKRTYKYVKDYNNSSISSGYLMNKPNYFWTGAFLDPDNTNNILDVFDISSSKSLLPLCVTGTHIGYSEVTEIEDGNGYTIYKYTMPPKIESASNPPYQDLAPIHMIGNAKYLPIIDRSLERGKLLSKEVYNNSSIPVKKTTYKYNSDPNRFENNVRSRNIQYIPAQNNVWRHNVLWDAIGYPPITGGANPMGTSIYIYTYPFYVEEETETNYVNGVKASTITNTYKHNTLGQVTAVFQTQSDGSEFITEYRYPKDYQPPYSENNMIKQLVDKHILNAEIEKISRIKKGSNDYIIGADYTKYGIFNNALKPQTVYSLNLDEPLQSSDYNGWLCAYRLIATSSFTLATSNTGNYHTQSISIKLNPGETLRFDPSSLGLDFKNKKGSEYWFAIRIQKDNRDLKWIYFYEESAPVPELIYTESGTYSFEIKYSYENQDHYGIWNPGYTIYDYNDITIHSSLKPAVTLNYNDKGNIIDIQKTNDIHTSYIWGYNNIFPVIKAENMDDATLSGIVTSALPSGFSTLESLLWSITSLPNANWITFNKNLRDYISSHAINCVVSTYTYSPLTGMTSQTDPNGQTTYYEYDSFGRLKLARDNDRNILKTYEYNYKN